MAGRPKGSGTTPKSATPKNNESDIKKENEQLKKELDEIKKMLAGLSQNKSEKTEIKNKSDYIIEDSEVEIKQNKYIKVMSLTFGKLVLSTEGKGRGKIFVFNKFGEVKNIIYSDLANLIHHQQTFAEAGKFYIFDKNVVRNHGLDEYYSKFLTKETIENILNYNRDEIINLFNNTTKSQQETIVNILIKKIVDGEDVDIAKIDIISRLSDTNIYDIARDKIQEKELLKE